MKKNEEKELVDYMPVPTETAEKAPASKKNGGRKKKAEEKPAKKTARKPRKKAVVPNFVVQDLAGNGITYDAIVEKVLSAGEGADIETLDIYVKADEGKAYYVVNGDVAGAVDLF